jgi:hypothetical protein
MAKDSEDLGPCTLEWKNPRCNWALLKVREGKYKGSMVGPGGI